MKDEQRLLRNCQDNIGYTFADDKILVLALSHSSSIQDGRGSNERLEFLGDSILAAVISALLYKELPFSDEGKLSLMKSSIVNTASLAATARSIDLNRTAFLGKSLKGSSLTDSVCANLYESVIGAVFLDGGLGAAESVILKTMASSISNILKTGPERNYKSLLQTHLQKSGKELPTYLLESVKGEHHKQEFEIWVEVDGSKFGPGCGSSKKEAEQSAAKACIESLAIPID